MSSGRFLTRSQCVYVGRLLAAHAAELAATALEKRAHATAGDLAASATARSLDTLSIEAIGVVRAVAADAREAEAWLDSARRDALGEPAPETAHG